MALSEAYHHTMSKPTLLKKVVEAEKYLDPRGLKTRAETLDAPRGLKTGDVEAETARSAFGNRWSTSMSSSSRPRSRAHHGAHRLQGDTGARSRPNRGAESGYPAATPVQQRTVEVPVPQILKETTEMDRLAPHGRVQRRQMQSQFLVERLVPRERAQRRPFFEDVLIFL